LPKALRDFLGFCFYFWSNEGSDSREPIHVHISRGKPTANATKIWLKPDGSLEISNNNSRLTDNELTKVLDYIRVNYNNIVVEWYRHFGM